MNKKNVIVVGLFSQNSSEPVTQGSELFKLLKAKGYNVLSVSKYRNKWLRLFDIILTLFVYKSKYEVAIIQFYSGNSLVWQYIAAKIVKLLRKKLIFTIHGGNVPDRIKKIPKRYIPLLKTADVVTAPSGFMIESLRKYDIDITLIENTVQLKNYPFYKKENIRPTILWMRAFSDIYNPQMALKCVAEIKNDYPNVKLFMGGPDLGNLVFIKQLISELGLKNNVEITGFLNFEQKKHYAEMCDVYISTNKIDNAPVTFLEMWAMGLPVVSTNVGGIPFIIDENKNGLLVNDDDYQTMAEKVILLIKNHSLANSIIDNARVKVNMYDEDIVYNKWDDLLKSI